MEGGGTDTYCVTVGRRGDDVLITTRVRDEIAIYSICLSGALCTVDDDVLRSGRLRRVLPR